MTHDNFNEVFSEVFAECDTLLNSKSKEYSTESDKLHNFHSAGMLQDIHPAEALSGMMAKHTISVYDMIRDTAGGKRYSVEKWDEKISDHINYLVLLKALLIDCGAFADKEED